MSASITVTEIALADLVCEGCTFLMRHRGRLAPSGFPKIAISDLERSVICFRGRQQLRKKPSTVDGDVQGIVLLIMLLIDEG